MMSMYYSKEDLIELLKKHITPEDAKRIDWDAVIEDGEVYHKKMKGISGTFIYDVAINDKSLITVFVHPFICTEVDYDAWSPKSVYMGYARGDIMW